MKPAGVLCLVLCLGAASCVQRPAPLPPLAALPPKPAAEAGLWVRLTWNGPYDLDLYVTDPTFETAYFANSPTRTGGKLVADARCRSAGQGKPSVELVTWRSPRPGRYRIGVDYIEHCEGGSEPVEFRVLAELDGWRLETEQVIELERFRPIVVEFTVRRQPDGQLSLEEQP